VKYAVITSNSYFSYLILSRLLDEYRHSISVMIEARGMIEDKSPPAMFLHVLRRLGLRGFCYKTGTAAYGRLLDKVADILPGIQRAFGPLTHARHLGIEVITFKDANSEPCLELLRTVHPDVIFAVNVYQKLRAPLLKLPRVGIINIHFGMLPWYRGMSPYMWAMAHGETEIGITAYFMDEQFDTGDIVIQESVPILSHDSVYALYVRGCLKAGHILTHIAAAARNSAIPCKPQSPDQGSYFSMAGSACIAEIRRRGHVLVRAQDLLRTAYFGVFAQSPEYSAECESHVPS